MAQATHTDSPIIDFSAHLYPKYPSAALENSTLLSTLKVKEGPIYKDFDAAEERFSAGGLDGAVLSNAFFMGSDDIELTQSANDTLLDIVSDHDGYYALASLPTAAGGEEAAEEFERCLENGFNGAGIETWFHTDNVTIETLEPVFEVADRTGAPIFYHPKVNESLGPGVLKDPYLTNSMSGRGAALSASLYKTIQHGYFDKYPNMNIVVHHMGGNIAGVVPRIEFTLERKLDDYKYVDAPAELKPFDEFMQQLRSNVYIDTAGFNCDYDTLQKALDVFPIQNILFGSDFPCEIRRGDGYKRLISRIQDATSAENADRILGANALELLVNVKKLAQ